MFEHDGEVAYLQQHDFSLACHRTSAVVGELTKAEREILAAAMKGFLK